MHIRYILGDMIPPNQGSSLSLDSSLNMTPMENCYIQGYDSPNEILQDISDRAWTILSVVKNFDHEGETLTRGSLYKFAMLKSLEIGHLGKTLINPNW